MFCFVVVHDVFFLDVWVKAMIYLCEVKKKQGKLTLSAYSPVRQSIIPVLIQVLIIACLDYCRILLVLPISDLLSHWRVQKLQLNSSSSPWNHITSLQVSFLLLEFSLNVLIVVNLVETNLIFSYPEVRVLFSSSIFFKSSEVL